MNKRITFLVPSLEQPRIVKRIVEMGNRFLTVDVIAFTRDIYNINNYDKLNDSDNINVIKLGSMIDNKYMRRAFLYMKLVVFILFKYGLKRKHIYVFGLDLRICCFFIINKKITYEISDIMWLYKSKPAKKILNSIDYFGARMSDHVVFTSEGFYKQYYSFLEKEKVTIRENKFKSYSLVFPIQSIIKDQIRIAYIGAFRYINIIKDLIASIAGNNQIICNFYGDGMTSVLEIIRNNANSLKNVFYQGTFKNPDDLEKIYAVNNLNFVAYDNNLDNEKVAMPNKFYESGYFNIPIVCSKNTLVGEKVSALNMGWTIDPTREGIDLFLNNLSLDEIVACHHRIKHLNKALFESTNEHSDQFKTGLLSDITRNIL